jgi:endonuclease/exonuclease/phosphatase family metal-dependent hydrolase
MKPIYYSLLFVLLSFSIGCSNKNAQQKTTVPLSLKIASFNVRNAKGMDNVADFDRVAIVINDMDADAVAIQELDSATERSNGKVVLDELAKRTNMFASFNASIDYSGGKYGIGILTKQEPLKKEAIALPGREEMRSLLVVELEDFVLCCTHLSLNEDDRQGSIRLIKQLTDEYTLKPVFLAGDLNASPNSDEIRNLSASWILLSYSTQATFPSDKPTEVIDYIFMKSNSLFSHIVKNAVVVNEPMASDHRPLWVDLKIE